VLHAGAGDGAAEAALETLCRQYWYPLYAFVRRQGRSHHEAEDCTQAFLAHLLAHDGIARARPDRGRFRTFLLAALQHFLTNEWHRALAAKRGGGSTVLSLDLAAAGPRFDREPVDPGLTPEQAFDRNWARDLLARATATVRQDYESSGRGPLFAGLLPLLWGKETKGSFAAAAEHLGLTPGAFTVALHRLRRRFGECVRALVSETVADPAELDAELHHLIAVVGSRGSDV
jgi:RNA polymerase sigma-70 factor (ECF subfamily)